MLYGLEVASSLLASVSEQGRGIQSSAAGRRPAELLELYDMEGCPFCRVVREALTDLDLDAMIYPCPKGGVRYRPLVEKLGGKQMFPFLMDPNTDRSLYESADIVEYLYEQYGNKPAPGAWLVKSVQTASSMGASVVRRGRGVRARNSNPPSEPLELFSFEGSPFARLVREMLTELEIPYILRQTGRTTGLDWVLPPIRERFYPNYEPEQRNRRELFERTGRVAVPYLIDRNTGQELYESRRIMDYLEDAYGA